MTGSIVSMLLEGVSFDDYTVGSSIDVAEANEITLEHGPAIMARKSADEIHELFELAIVATNEAALGAYMEGCADVMESATYGPVFEASEKSFGKKVLDFLKKIKDRVAAFFRDIFAKISETINNYDKFFTKNEKAMAEAESKRGGGVKNVKITNWNDNLIDGLAKRLRDGAGTITDITAETIRVIKDAYSKANDSSKSAAWQAKATADFNKAMDEQLGTLLKTFGIKANASGTDTTEINSICQKMFRLDGTKTETIDVNYVRSTLKGVNAAAKEVKDAQKAFDGAYNKAIKDIKSITDEMEKNDAKGYASFINKATSNISKVQNIMNAYAQAGYRALIGRANESKSLCRVIITGKAGKRAEEEKKDN